MPYENYRKVFRTSQKHIERELTALQTAAHDLVKKVANGEATEETLKAIDGMTKRAETLKRKACPPVVIYCGDVDRRL